MTLRKLRKNNGMTQTELAEKLIVNQQTISAWENGRSIPGKLRRKKLNEIFETKIDW